jgi:glucose/arabinose dehydrogenase
MGYAPFRRNVLIASIFSACIFSLPIMQAHADESLKVGLKTIASGLTAPVSGVAAPGDPQHLYVVDQIGEILQIDLVSGQKNLFLDVKNRLVPLGLPSLGGYDERGLLGLAFHPDFATNHLFYTFTTEPTDSPNFVSTPVDHDNVIREWNAATPGASRVVVRIANPQFNHTGGAIAFGPDRMLYIALGDGGGEDDQDCQIGVDGTVTSGHGANGTGQDPGSILASILRINPDPAGEGAQSTNRQYRIPLDNPGSIVFAAGKFNVFPEVWAKGLRNPFRFSFDATSSQLIAGDVGQDDLEEIDIVSKGGNYGWRIKEANFLFDPRGCAIMGFQTDGRAVRESPGFPAFATDPIAQYHHNQGIAVIAGFVYHGTAVPELRGKYVFGDYSKDSDKPRGTLFHLASPVSGNRNEVKQIGNRLDIFVLGFGQDSAGELYVLGNATGIPSGTTGVVRKIVRRFR